MEERRTIIHEVKCVECGEDFTALRSNKAVKPRYCNNVCRQKGSARWINKTKFVWATGTEQERAAHIKKYYERNVIRRNGCWDWKRKCKGEKYVRMNYCRNEPRISVHVYSWKINHGDIPVGMLVCHKCDNPRCSNPEHLFLGSSLDNNRDCIKKNRNAKGSKHGNAKFNEKVIDTIKDQLRLGVTATRIAKDHNVSISTICRIRSGETWKHV